MWWLAQAFGLLTQAFVTKMVEHRHALAWRATTGRLDQEKHKMFVLVAVDHEAERVYAVLKDAGLLCEVDIGIGNPRPEGDPFGIGETEFVRAPVDSKTFFPVGSAGGEGASVFPATTTSGGHGGAGASPHKSE